MRPQARNRTDDTGMNDNPRDATTRRCIFQGTQQHRDGKYMGRKIPEPAVRGHIGRGHIDIAPSYQWDVGCSSAHHVVLAAINFLFNLTRDNFWRYKADGMGSALFPRECIARFSKT